jgi:hypothetical protein
MRRRGHFESFPLFLSVAILSCVGIAAFAGAASAQDAGKIVEQYVKAAGGAKALARIQTLTIEGRVTNPGNGSAPGSGAAETGAAGGNSGTYTLDTKVPNRYYSELIVGSKHLIEAYNGKSAWHQAASGEIATLIGTEAVQMAAVGQIANSRLLNLKKNKLVVTFAGHATVREKDALQVEVVTASGVKREIFFDPQTHLIVEESAPVGGVEESIFYEDYRAGSGVMLPHKIELHRGSETFAIEVTRAEINGTVGERVFDFPRKSQVQLPDLKALFKEIDDNQKAIDKIKENYAGARSEEETQYDGSGKVKEHEVKEYTFFYLQGHEISTLVKKDGKPLSADQQKKENEQVQKHIEAVEKRDAKKEAKEAKAKEEGKEDDDEVGIETFLRACQFVNPRRERFRGQDVLVFDFEGNPDFKPHKLAERLIQKLAGVIWIDEKAHDVARLEAYFVGDVKIMGGLLANLQKGTSFTFEQAYINNEVWLPTYAEVHVGVRILLVKGMKINEVTRFSDYKKFHVESLSTVAPPRPQ